MKTVIKWSKSRFYGYSCIRIFYVCSMHMLRHWSDKGIYMYRVYINFFVITHPPPPPPPMKNCVSLTIVDTCIFIPRLTATWILTTTISMVSKISAFGANRSVSRKYWGYCTWSYIVCIGLMLLRFTQTRNSRYPCSLFGY